MPEKTKKTADPVTAAVQDLQDAGLGPLAWMGTAWTEAMSDIGSEMMSFLSDRIQEDVKTQHKILHCKTLTELQEAQTAFLERAYVQYTVETGKIVKMSTAIFPATNGKVKSTPL
jgi:S-methylmethionine-dependent homocysteine/selenocysteine methylase